MGEVTWIEILAHQRETVTRQRVSGSPITIGRAYDNDIVLDDPYVAAHHLRLQRGEDGHWNAEDLGTRNGTRVAGMPRDRVTLGGDTVLQVGQTGIRLRSSAYAVPPELPLSRARSHWPAGLACLVAVLGFALLQLWLNETGEFKLISGYLSPLVLFVVMIAVWVAIWSGTSRTLTPYAQFGRHLFIASAGVLVFMIYDALTEIGAFALSLPSLVAYGFVAAWVILALVCFAHLRAIGHSHLALKAVCVFALAGLGIAMQGMNRSEQHSRSGQPVPAILEKLQPPALRLAPPQAQGAFFDAAAGLKAALDKARTKELPPGSDDD